MTEKGTKTSLANTHTLSQGYFLHYARPLQRCQVIFRVASTTAKSRRGKSALCGHTYYHELCVTLLFFLSYTIHSNRRACRQDMSPRNTRRCSQSVIKLGYRTKNRDIGLRNECAESSSLVLLLLPRWHVVATALAILNTGHNTHTNDAPGQTSTYERRSKMTNAQFGIKSCGISIDMESYPLLVLTSSHSRD